MLPQIPLTDETIERLAKSYTKFFISEEGSNDSLLERSAWEKPLGLLYLSIDHGTEICSANNGKVVLARTTNMQLKDQVKAHATNMVVIDHGGVFGHYTRLIPEVEVGQSVEKGEFLGKHFATYNVDPHMHFQMSSVKMPMVPATVRTVYKAPKQYLRLQPGF